MDDLLAELCGLALRHAGTQPAWPKLRIGVRHETSAFATVLYEPMLCVVLQGAKEALIGERMMRYDPASYFLASVELPAMGRIVQASRERPCVAVGVRLDVDLVPEVLPGMSAMGGQGPAGFAVGAMTRGLLDPLRRMFALLDDAAAAPVLAPLIERELLFRLLQGPQGETLRQLANGESRLSRIRRAIGWIRTHYDQPLRVEALAALSGMSAASFHRHFRTVTATSPLQYQKSLRLHAARGLLLADHEAARAGYAVGYESASQFSREYLRLFGVPPSREAGRHRPVDAEAP